MKNELPFIPGREAKPRDKGLTMMMDKGLSMQEAESFTESAGAFTDLVKFGFGTALITSKLEEKIKIYREGNIRPYFGGTLFEMFIVRDRFDDFRKFIGKYKLDVVEISDGSIHLNHEEKLKYIDILSKEVTVLSEVGSKMKGVEIAPDDWVMMMKTELETGAWKVIAEARESGTIGIYNADGSANMDIINDIIEHVDTANVLWEAPNKNQQVWFINLSGANVNLGNIAPGEVVPLEALRLGMRGDTFFNYLPSEFDKFKQ